ncbi:uncharacterized protein Pyn_23447 [Prunus yedoensis var. nudiflora]|uniref:Uncharacterized protein n=1 Tax=Prunus yedoensis var. nudiflora TaxID=2094558 RepID=A0A314UI85_PRUYE|nr:uncharacterized protein Pyn_23447 [Prunus yedoensis var. nudiflora]
MYLTNIVRDQKINVNSRLVGDTWNKDETNISLKLIVSKSKGVVCYAEAGEDFVNLLFSFLIVPLGFILKEMHAGSSKGCIDQLYKSIQNLDEQYLKSDYYNKMLLDPEVALVFAMRAIL